MWNSLFPVLRGVRFYPKGPSAGPACQVHGFVEKWGSETDKSHEKGRVGSTLEVKHTVSGLKKRTGALQKGTGSLRMGISEWENETALRSCLLFYQVYISTSPRGYNVV